MANKKLLEQIVGAFSEFDKSIKKFKAAEGIAVKTILFPYNEDNSGSSPASYVLHVENVRIENKHLEAYGERGCNHCGEVAKPKWYLLSDSNARLLLDCIHEGTQSNIYTLDRRVEYICH